MVEARVKFTLNNEKTKFSGPNLTESIEPMIKSIVTYLLLIGIPLAGLLWILDYGAAIEAPPAIEGDWKVEGDLTGCLGEQPTTLSFHQSGRFVQVELGAASGEARLDDERLSAHVVEPSGACTGVELEGAFDEATEQFTGRVSGSGCRACRDVEIMAKRVQE
jgi:hypothetical protein